jgi:hypothetical protein
MLIVHALYLMERMCGPLRDPDLVSILGALSLHNKDILQEDLQNMKAV